MARLGVQEEEKLVVLKYVCCLSLYIQQEIDFMTISMLVDAFHYANKPEAKQKGKARFVNKLKRSNIRQEVTSRLQQVQEPFSTDSAEAR